MQVIGGAGTPPITGRSHRVAQYHCDALVSRFIKLTSSSATRGQRRPVSPGRPMPNAQLLVPGRASGLTLHERHLPPPPRDEGATGRAASGDAVAIRTV